MKEYIKKFESAVAAHNYAIVDIPFTTSVAPSSGYPSINYIQNLVCNQTGKKLINDNGIVLIYDDGPVIPNNEIHYTATEKITPNSRAVFGANYLSGDSTFDETTGEGVLKFDGDVTSVGDYAFEYCDLISVMIPNSVTSIGDYAFAWCSGLTSVTIGNSVTTIGDNAFFECESLAYVTIPDSVTNIGDDAFYGCHSLTSVTLGNSVVSIGDGSFAECENLSAITIPSSVTNIDEHAFGNGHGWSGVSPIFDITFLSTTPISLINDNQKVKNILGSVDYYTSLSIHVPQGYESIYAEHDEGWEILAPFIVGYVPRVTIFHYNDGTTSESEDTELTSDSYDQEKKLVSVEIGSCVISIGNCAFDGCSGLTSVTIPNSVTSIGWGAFDSCIYLQRVNITDIKSWCETDFEDPKSNPLSNNSDLYLNNEKITSLDIPNSVTNIKDYVFCGCSSLTSVTIPDSVESIGDYAFNKSDYEIILNSITFESIEPISLEDEYGSARRLFGSVDYLTNFVIHVPEGYESTYATHDAGWELYASHIEGYVPPTPTIFHYDDGTTGESYDTELTSSSYNTGKTLASVEIGSEVTSIGSSAFYQSYGLTSVTISNSVTSIGEEAFYNCSGLTSVTIPTSVTSIGNGAFENIAITATFLSATPKISLVNGTELIQPFGGYDASSSPVDISIIVPAGCKAAYVAKDAGWEYYADYITEAQ